jgi:hypothetical protein
MEFLTRLKIQNPVCQTGAKTGSILVGAAKNNRGLRLQIMHDQPRSPGGPIVGDFEILDVGDNKHSACLETLAGQATNAHQVIRTIRQESPQCVNIVNSSILVVE